MTEADYPKWQNCYADVIAHAYPRIARDFFNGVVVSAIAKLDADIGKYRQSEDPIDSFYLSDCQELKTETLKAFCLSVQSIWERQIRSYLQQCAIKIIGNDSMGPQIRRADWAKLNSSFGKLRNYPLTYFKAYDDLETLYYLANVCRHGDGKSADTLIEKRPDFWPNPEHKPPMMPNGNATNVERFRASNMVVTLNDLQRFVTAVESFWNQAAYIYNESIEPKHPNLEATLKQQRTLWL